MIRHTELTLRDYQTECISAVWGAWPGGMQRPAVVLPTGAGKTVIFASLARDFVDIHRLIGDAYRVVILVHRDELADQAIDKMRKEAPDLKIGKVKAGDNEVHSDIMVCSVQTLARDTRLRQLVGAQTISGPVGLVIVDECHHAAAPSYRRVMEELGCFSWTEGRDHNGLPEYTGTRTAGFTATLARGDGVGLGDVWDDVVYTKTVLWMIAHGYLVDVRALTVDLELDLSAVKTSGGDYQAKSLGDALMACDGPRAIAHAVYQHAADRRPIVFTPDVATVYAVSAELDRLGITNDVVTGDTTRETRQLVYKRYRTGEIQALVNCMVLTEGADFPWADCAVIARPTKSAPLYIQMVGRVLRTWPGKADALVLNVVGEGGVISTLVDLDPGLITEPEQGQSLAEAYIAQEARAETRVSADHLLFELKYREVDLFAASGLAWLRTRGGVMFLSRGDGEVFLWPDREGAWTVGFAPANNGPWQPLHRDLPLGLAMAWAETEAGSDALTQKTKRWRKELAEPRQIAKARSIGILVEEPATKGEVSDAISIVTATGRFDERMRKLER